MIKKLEKLTSLQTGPQKTEIPINIVTEALRLQRTQTAPKTIQEQIAEIQKKNSGLKITSSDDFKTIKVVMEDIENRGAIEESLAILSEIQTITDTSNYIPTMK